MTEEQGLALARCFRHFRSESRASAGVFDISHDVGIRGDTDENPR